MKTFSKPHALWLLLLLSVLTFSKAHGQATVSYPFAVGTQGCASGTQEIQYYTYNSTTNVIANATGGLVGTCVPQLRIGLPANGTQRFTTNLASVSYNPKDHNIYYLITLYAPNALTQGAPARTFVWRWPIGTCAGTATNKLDTLRSFAADILGVAFGTNGNSYIIDFTSALPTVPPTYKAMLRSIDFTTGMLGAADTLALTGNAKIYQQGSGDVAMTPSGQMFFVVDNKFFTPDYTAYTGTGANLTCTYIDTIKLTGNFVGLTYAQGQTIAAYSGGGCPYYEINPLTAATSNITKNNTPTTVYSASDMATVVSGIGAAKNLVSVTNVTGSTYTVVYDIYIKNYGNYDLTNVQVTDDLTAINGISNLGAVVTTSFISNPAGLTLNPLFNGNTNKNLLNGTGTLPNYPVANNNAVIRVTCTLSGINSGTIYNNSATATATGFNGVAITDVSTNGTTPDLNSNDKPDDAGENQPTPFLIAVTSQTPPCASLSTVLYSQTFGSGAGNVTAIPAPAPGSTGATAYTGSTTQPLAVDQYMVTSNANNANTAQFISLTDHTGNANGRMMVINADVSSSIMYQGTVSTLCPNQQYSLIFYAAFVGNTAYQTLCNGFGGFKYPKIKMRIRDFNNPSLVISQISTTDITSTAWTQYGMKFIMPSGFTSIIIDLVNDAPGGCGNDIALDDIQFGLCSPVPTVSLATTSSGCIGGSTSFAATLSDPSALATPVYQWQVSSNNATWANASGGTATAATYVINPLAAGNVNMYYRVKVAASGNMGTAGCEYISPSFLLTAKTLSTAPAVITKSKLLVCAGETFSLKASGATLGDGAIYKWYTGSCGGTLVGTGQVISVSPTVPTTYYVRVEGDCNTTTCISTSITFSCDIDKDKDGITDVAESGGLVPDADNDFDGILNYQDPDFCTLNVKGVCANMDMDNDGIPNFKDLDSDNDGIPDVVESGGVDANGDGKIDNFFDTDNDGLSQNVDASNTGYTGSGTGLGIPDLDGDGVPNFLDLDSDNDGIPDVVEAGGTDANNDGMIDGFTDTDSDGFSQNVDGDTNNDGIAESSANALLRTGADTNNDGRADSYPFKNMDGDGKANPYDLDSDGDGITDVREVGFADTDANGQIDGTYNSRGWSTTVSALASLSLLNSDTDPTGKTYPNYLDIDSDNDGIPDNIEGQPTLSYVLPSYIDADGDGIDNSYDSFNGFGGSGITPVNTDGDAQPDYIDQDSDGDGAIDRIEGNDFNLNDKQDDLVSLLNTDADGDGLDDRFDNDNATARGTSAYMGNGGSFTGPSSPGSRTMVQRTLLSHIDRDWRDVGVVLDVNFIAVKAVLRDGQVHVDWTVLQEKDVVAYTVERSIDGSTFRSLQTISSTAAENYAITDTVSAINAATLYYRIHAVLQNGKGGYSRYAAVTLRNNSNYNLAVFPNPANQSLQMRLYAIADGAAVFTISTLEGRRIDQFTKHLAPGYNLMAYRELSRLANGVYILQMNLQGTMQTVRFTVQH